MNRLRSHHRQLMWLFASPLGAFCFATIASAAANPAPVNIRAAGEYAILAKSGITNVPTSAIKGDVGVSPITGAAIAGLTCKEVTGTIYTVDEAGPAPCSVMSPRRLTATVLDMEAAYKDAAGREPDVTELGSGDIGGLTLVRGVYKWSSAVNIPTDVTLSGGKYDVWIFQIAGGLHQAAATRVNLIGGALAKNIFWQVNGVVHMGATAHFEGVILSHTAITLVTGATVNGRLLAQTNVTLESNIVAEPAE